MAKIELAYRSKTFDVIPLAFPPRKIRIQGMRFIETLEFPKPISLASVLKKKRSLTLFFKNKPVDLVFVHGALARDDLKPLSDIDVAVLFRERKYQYEDIYKVVSKLEAIIGREDIDLAVLNRASPLFWMQVLRKGIVLYARSQKVLKIFRLRTIQRYLATKYLRTTFNQRVAETILKG